MTQEQLKELLRSQQGELNAVLMYQRLAKVVKNDEHRHGDIVSGLL
jgi:rubrerythrin